VGGALPCLSRLGRQSQLELQRARCVPKPLIPGEPSASGSEPSPRSERDLDTIGENGPRDAP